MSTTLQELPRNPMREALEDHQRIVTDNMTLRDQLREEKEHNSRLSAELDLARQELHRTQKERRFLQAFASVIGTRLNVINETITAAQAEAQRYGVKMLSEQELTDEELGHKVDADQRAEFAEVADASGSYNGTGSAYQSAARTDG